MKKYLLLTTALIASLSAASSDNSTSIKVESTSNEVTFGGFYAGAVAGYSRTNYKSSVAAGGTTFKSNKTAHNHGFSYGLVGGYGKSFNSFYLGGEVGVHMDTTDDKKNTFKYDDGSMKASYKRGPVFTIAPRLGVVFCNSYMAYIKPAVEISKDKTSGTDEDGDKVNSKAKVKYAFAPAVGLEKFFNNNFLGRVEYNHNFGANVKGSDASGLVHTHKHSSDSVKIGAIYQF